MKLKSIKLAALAFAGILSLGVITAPAFANNACDNICNPGCQVADSVKEANGCNNTTTEETLPKVVIKILNAIIGVSGLVAVVFIILGGIQYMTSTGDAGKVKKAKDTILYAVIGLVACVLAFAIVNFVITEILKL